MPDGKWKNEVVRSGEDLILFQVHSKYIYLSWNPRNGINNLVLSDTMACIRASLLRITLLRVLCIFVSIPTAIGLLITTQHTGVLFLQSLLLCKYRHQGLC